MAVTNLWKNWDYTTTTGKGNCFEIICFFMQITLFFQQKTQIQNINGLLKRVLREQNGTGNQDKISFQSLSFLIHLENVFFYWIQFIMTKGWALFVSSIGVWNYLPYFYGCNQLLETTGAARFWCHRFPISIFSLSIIIVLIHNQSSKTVILCFYNWFKQLRPNYGTRKERHFFLNVKKRKNIQHIKPVWILYLFMEPLSGFS